MHIRTSSEVRRPWLWVEKTIIPIRSNHKQAMDYRNLVCNRLGCIADFRVVRGVALDGTKIPMSWLPNWIA